jgi:hypothetical protein
MEEIVIQLEERLRLAMLNSDISELEKLISPDLVFTNHLGGLVSKAEDLDAHRNRVYKFKTLKLFELQTVKLENCVIVSAKAEIKGCFNGQQADGNFRFTRLWSNISGNWQVVAGHSSLIA